MSENVGVLYGQTLPDMFKTDLSDLIYLASYSLKSFRLLFTPSFFPQNHASTFTYEPGQLGLFVSNWFGRIGGLGGVQSISRIYDTLGVITQLLRMSNPNRNFGSKFLLSGSRIICNRP